MSSSDRITLYAALRHEIGEALQNRNRSDLISRVSELSDDEIGEAARLMVDCVEQMLSARRDPARPFIIVSDGPKSRGEFVVDPDTSIGPARFAAQSEARAYADSLVPSMPSGCLPLRVTREA